MYAMWEGYVYGLREAIQEPSVLQAMHEMGTARGESSIQNRR